MQYGDTCSAGRTCSTVGWWAEPRGKYEARHALHACRALGYAPKVHGQAQNRCRGSMARPPYRSERVLVSTQCLNAGFEILEKDEVDLCCQAV